MTTYHTLKYGTDGYLKASTFKDSKQHSYMLKAISITKIRNNDNPIIRHHKKNYNGKLPYWALSELLTFSQISKMYTNLLDTDVDNIVKNYFNSISAIDLKSFIWGVSHFRNHCCHFGRLFKFVSTVRPIKYRKSFVPVSVKNFTTFYLILILFLLNPNRNLGLKIINDIKHSARRSNVDLENWYGFPGDWENVLRNANSYCIKD